MRALASVTQDNTPPGPIVEARFLHTKYDSNTTRHVFGSCRSDHSNDTLLLFGTPTTLFMLMMSSNNRALKIGAGGVLSCVTNIRHYCCCMAFEPRFRSRTVRLFSFLALFFFSFLALVSSSGSLSFDSLINCYFVCMYVCMYVCIYIFCISCLVCVSSSYVVQ